MSTSSRSIRPAMPSRPAGATAGYAATGSLSAGGGAVCASPPFLSAVIELIRKPEERDWLVHLSLTGKSAGRPIMLALLTLVLLPYDTLICLDAILRSGVRMLFTRHGLLLWHVRSYARPNACRTP